MSGETLEGFGGPRRPIVETLEYIPQPESGWTGVTTGIGAATLGGASFVLPRPVQMNRIILRSIAFAAPATAVLFLYQAPGGVVADSLDLVASVDWQPVANTTFTLTPAEGDVLLSDGLFYALWGQDSGAGSFSVRTFNTASVTLLNSLVEAGVHPTVAASALDPAAPPASINPLIGGDLTEEASDDLCPVIRFLNV